MLKESVYSAFNKLEQELIEWVNKWVEPKEGILKFGLGKEDIEVVKEVLPLDLWNAKHINDIRLSENRNLVKLSLVKKCDCVEILNIYVITREQAKNKQYLEAIRHSMLESVEIACGLKEQRMDSFKYKIKRGKL